MIKSKYAGFGGGVLLLLVCMYAARQFTISLSSPSAPYIANYSEYYNALKHMKTDKGEPLDCRYVVKSLYEGVLCKDTEGKVFTGTGKSYRSNGSVEMEAGFKDGRPDGVTRLYFSRSAFFEYDYSQGKLVDERSFSYYESGELASAGQYEKEEDLFKLKIYYKSGRLKGEENYNNHDRPRGVFREYYENGNLQEERDYGTDDRSYSFAAYHENGQLKEKGHFDMSRKTGNWRFYDEIGRLKAEDTYGDGVSVGKGRKYYENGKLKAEWDCSSRGDCPFAAYYGNGQLKEKGNVNTYGFRKYGEWKFYYENGQLKAEGKYSSDRMKVGTWKEYYDNGKLKAEKTYTDNGRKNGTWKEYYENGKPKAEGMYNHDEREGYWAFYYDNGQLKAEGVYSWDGMPTKEWRFYYENGQTESVGEYVSGQRVNTWKFYDENGQLKEERDYTGGEMPGDGSGNEEEGVGREAAAEKPEPR